MSCFLLHGGNDDEESDDNDDDDNVYCLKPNFKTSARDSYNGLEFRILFDA